MRGARDQRGAKVLIVDDDPEMCALLKDTLQDEGYSVDTAGSGAEALAKAASARFELVITDLQMKGIKGVELTRRLLRSDPELPIIIITAFGSIESAVESMKLGAYHYLTKPFRMEEVTVLVEKA
ncbi:MAG: response regulator, partial [Nitrospinota bacterium]